MNYSQKYYEEIFESMLQDSLENGLISHAEDFQDFIANKQDISNYYVMDKAVIATMFARVYEDITRVYESAKVDYAEDYDLDDIGKIVGVPRPEATKSSVKVLFSLNEIQEEDVTIPEGFTISTDLNGVEYETISELYFPAGTSNAYATCMSKDTGPDTRVVPNSLTTVISNNDYNLSCNNNYSSSGGNLRYTDDEYRDLLKNWIKIQLKGSLEAFEYYFATVSGVDDYRIVQNWDGAGSVKIIIDPGDDTLFELIYDEFISITATVNVDIDVLNPYSQLEKEDIQARIISAIKVFIDGGKLSDGSWYPGLGLGEDFIPHKLAVFLDDEIPELKNITFTTPSDYIKILDEERGISDDITIEMI